MKVCERVDKKRARCERLAMPEVQKHLPSRVIRYKCRTTGEMKVDAIYPTEPGRFCYYCQKIEEGFIWELKKR
jgi:hypothetical protein